MYSEKLRNRKIITPKVFDFADIIGEYVDL